MEAIIMTITPKSGRIDSFGLWRSIEGVTRWINEELGDECVRSFPTTYEEEGAFKCAFLTPPEKLTAFQRLAPSIIRKIRSRHRHTKCEILHVVPMVDSVIRPPYGSEHPVHR